jgi:acyl carrier protein
VAGVGARAALAFTPFDIAIFLRANPTLSLLFLEHEVAGHSAHGRQEHQALQSGVTHRQSSEDIKQVVLELLESMIGSSLDLQQPLSQAGLDSLGAIELRNSLQTRLSVELPATVLFDHPTADELTLHICSLARAPSDSPAAFTIATHQYAGRDLSNFAPMTSTVEITSAAARLPFDAQQFSHALDAVTVVPLDRWDVEPEMLITETTSSRYLSFRDITTIRASHRLQVTLH